MSFQERVFPLLDRRAPILERVRNGRASSLGSALASKLNDFIREEDDSLKEEEIQRIQSDFRTSVAEHLGVEEDMVRDEVIEMTTQVFQLDESEILLPIEEPEADDTDEDVSDEEGEEESDGSELFD